MKDEVSTLFVRTGALGDFCITLPVLEALFALGGRVDVMCQPRFDVLVREVGTPGRVWDAGGIESMWLFGGGAQPRGKDLPHYQRAIAFSAAHAEALTALGIPEVHWVEARPPGSARPAGSPRELAGVRAVDHFRSVWPGVSNSTGRARPHCALPGDLSRTVVIAPGASAERKRWPMDRWHAVAAGLTSAGFTVRWVGGPLEPWATDRPDLAGLLHLARSCHAWLGADSGPAHLAAWAGARVGVVARKESWIWAPDGAWIYDWDVAVDVIVDDVLSSR